jgi:hypothetical protein
VEKWNVLSSVTHHGQIEMVHPHRPHWWRRHNSASSTSGGLSPKTATNLYRCTIESILSGCIIAWYSNCTTYHRGKTTCPPGHLHHPMSQEGKKDHQGQQPPEPLPVHPAIIQKARSIQLHQSWDRETEKQLLSQGSQTVNQPSLTLSCCCQHTDSNL